MVKADPNEILNYLFNSKIKVKILKFLFRNYPGSFRVSDISEMVGDTPRKANRELAKLISVGLITSKMARFRQRKKNEEEKTDKFLF